MIAPALGGIDLGVPGHILSPIAVFMRHMRQGEKDMKKTIVRIILAMLFLVASGSAPILADGGDPRPLCIPPQVCG